MTSVTYNPVDPGTQQCPFPAYKQLRGQAPVHQEPRTGWWFVTRYADVVDVFRRPGVFSSRVGKFLRPAPPPELAEKIAAIRAQGWPEVPVLVVEDPPVHRSQRTMVQRAFSPRRVASMEPGIRRIARSLAEQLPTARHSSSCLLLLHHCRSWPLPTPCTFRGTDRRTSSGGLTTGSG
jgi:cytochrome P450